MFIQLTTDIGQLLVVRRLQEQVEGFWVFRQNGVPIERERVLSTDGGLRINHFQHLAPQGVGQCLGDLYIGKLTN